MSSVLRGRNRPRFFLRAPDTARAALVALLLAPPMPVEAQDALRGKRLFLDVARIRAAGVSCVDCHGALPPGLFGIGRAANDPVAVERAVNSIPQMTPLRGKLTGTDYADLAAYIGNPGVPSPNLRVSTGSGSGDRIDFGTLPAGQPSSPAAVTLLNDGALPLLWRSDARIVGTHAGEYRIVGGNCRNGEMLAAGMSCMISVDFLAAASATGLRTAALQVDHDWIGGQVGVALLGTASSSSVVPPVAPGGSGGGGSLAWAPVVALLGAGRWRRSMNRPARPGDMSRTGHKGFLD